MSSIKEVAKHAGVGIGTVSRVINNSGYVSEATRKKVEEAIKELNYLPNEIARSFKTKSSRIVALILPTIHHPLFSELAFHLEKRLNELGYKLMLCNSNYEVQKEQEFIDLLNRNIIDGIVFISNSDIDRYITEEMVVVAIDRHFTHERAFLASDNYAGGRIAAEKLLEFGCQRPAYIGGFPSVDTEVHERKSGFVAVMKERNIDCILFDEVHTLADESDFVRDFVAAYPNIDGVFALTDSLANFLLAEYQKQAIAVPEQVQVIGYDGIHMFNFPYTHLSTIRQPIEAMGAVAAERITAIIEGDNPQKRTILPVTFREGQTTRRRT